MEQTESLDTINNRLADIYGRDIITNQPIWRVIWSEDQLEKRLCTHTPEGLSLLYPVIREVPKYKQWVQAKFILERLSLVPDYQQGELADAKISYEPVWVFEHAKTKEALPAKYEACEFIIDIMYAAIGKTSAAKYKDPGETIEMREERIKQLQEELFGNETPVGDALAHGYGTTVPNNYERN